MTGRRDRSSAARRRPPAVARAAGRRSDAAARVTRARRRIARPASSASHHVASGAMTAPARNLVNLHSVEKGYGTRSVLRGVTLGLAEGDRVGIVGRNGEGKSTLLRLIAGAEAPDAGTVTRTGGVETALLGQGDELGAGRTIRQELVGGRADHEWAADSAFRAVLDGLLGGVGIERFPAGLDTPIAPLSGGERRRIALARALLGH